LKSFSNFNRELKVVNVAPVTPVLETLTPILVILWLFLLFRVRSPYGNADGKTEGLTRCVKWLMGWPH